MAITEVTAQHDEEARTPERGGRGGWITFPFVTVGVTGMALSGSGWSSNLIVYSFSGSFCVTCISSFLNLLGMILMTLTATVSSLRPPHCTNGSETCKSPSRFQFTILYTAIMLICIGLGGTRFTLATLGADQFDKAEDQSIFFNWFFFTLYVASALGFTPIVYVQDKLGWGIGFGLCLAANAIALVVILLGKRDYRCVKPQGNPFMRLACVIVATILKRKVVVSSESESKSYYYGKSEETKLLTPAPSLSRLQRNINGKSEETIYLDENKQPL